jgi:hypothetical protein
MGFGAASQYVIMAFIKYKQRSFAQFQLLLRELGSLVMERILPSADEETALTTRVGRAG